MKCMVGSVKHGGGKGVLVWGAFGLCGVGSLVFIPNKPTDPKFTAASYISLLEENLTDSLDSALPLSSTTGWIFQQDNDPKHKAKITTKFFGDKKIVVLEWPPQSPDLNPIENLGHVMKIELQKISFHVRSDDELHVKLLNVWKSISVEYCKKLIASMPKRMSMVVNAKGGPINY